MQVTIHLEGDAAKQIVRKIAFGYAFLSIQSRLTQGDTVNAPWFDYGVSMVSAHRKWLRRVDRERISYRRALASFLPDVPPPPEVEWRPYASPNGKIYPIDYVPKRAINVARDYADQVMKFLAQPHEAAGGRARFDRDNATA
jgi:hypothetical protein